MSDSIGLVFEKDVVGVLCIHQGYLDLSHTDKVNVFAVYSVL